MSNSLIDRIKTAKTVYTEWDSKSIVQEMEDEKGRFIVVEIRKPEKVLFVDLNEEGINIDEWDALSSEEQHYWAQGFFQTKYPNEKGVFDGV